MNGDDQKPGDDQWKPQTTPAGLPGQEPAEGEEKKEPMPGEAPEGGAPTTE